MTRDCMFCGGETTVDTAWGPVVVAHDLCEAEFYASLAVEFYASLADQDEKGTA